jgi:hypothetical protein
LKNIAAVLKDRAVLAGWIAALVIVASLAWSLTFSFRLNLLMGAVNRSLALAGDSRRLSQPLPQNMQAGGILGGWYSMPDSDSLFVVFAAMREGILVPCGAELSPEGRVAEIIPIGSHAAQAAGSVLPGITAMYTRRIEKAFEASFPVSPVAGLSEAQR